MSTPPPPSNPPAGWYSDPEGAALQRWWNGATWTEHAQAATPAPTPVPISPPVVRTRRQQIASESAARLDTVGMQPKTYYWSNLFRFRYLWFLLTGPLVLAIGLSLIRPVLMYSYFILLPFLAWFFLRQQMACRHCGKVLAVTKLGGPVEVCKACHKPTDEGLRTLSKQRS